MINWTEKAEEAVERLLETDRQVAELRVKWERDKRKAKREWAITYQLAPGKNIEERKAWTEVHERYQTTQAAEMTSMLEYEAMRNERDTAETVIDFWRSWNREKGQI